MSSGCNRDGFALLIVLLLMAVGTALMFSALNGATAEDETTQAGTLRRRTIVAAESELWRTATSQSVAVMRSSPLGQVGATARTSGDVTLITTVDKVDTSNVWIVATATIRRGGAVARHRIGLSVLMPRDTTELMLRPVPERAWTELF